MVRCWFNFLLLLFFNYGDNLDAALECCKVGYFFELGQGMIIKYKASTPKITNEMGVSDVPPFPFHTSQCTTLITKRKNSTTFFEQGLCIFMPRKNKRRRYRLYTCLSLHRTGEDF